MKCKNNPGVTPIVPKKTLYQCYLRLYNLALNKSLMAAGSTYFSLKSYLLWPNVTKYLKKVMKGKVSSGAQVKGTAHHSRDATW